jgi:ABC-type lipoprotein export system ATPase subunit
MATVGRLQRIEIEGLFGTREVITIKLDPERPTVLTGGNGTGKSTILRLVGAASSLDLMTLQDAPVRKFRLYFDEIPRFALNRDARSTSIQWGENKYTLRSNGGLETLPLWAVEALGEESGANDMSRQLRKYAQEHGIEPGEYRMVRDALFGSLPGIKGQPTPSWFADFKEAFTVLHVTDQRLVVDVDPDRRRYGAEPPRSSHRAVVAASKDIAGRMLEIDSQYARASQARDRSFPREVISAMSNKTQLSNENFQSLLSQVSAKREELRRVGLLDTEQTFDENFGVVGLERPDVRPVIATFLESTLFKLNVLDELSARLQTFKGFLDARFKTKRMELRRREGVRFVLPGGGEIAPEQLSSGEQQLFVLAYEILFRATRGTLLIVDEPEISLHVLWQDTLIDDLVALGSPSAVQYLMATHSPALLAFHPELERSLDGRG